MQTNNYVIDVKNLTKKFGKKVVVNNVSLQIPKGKIYGFLGPNGSGKTTTIRILCGLLKADDGIGSVLGYDIKKQSTLIKKNVGYMTQKFTYWQDLTIYENLEFVAKMFAMPNPKEAVLQCLESLGLLNRKNELAGNLSGGWKQRLALAASILHKPQILLLDEPTAGVDPKARRDFWESLHALAAQGLTVLVSTHYMDEAERCDSIIYINQGNIIASGSVEEVIKNSGLFTYIIKGEDIMGLKQKLDKLLEDKNIAQFGNSLHISFNNLTQLEDIITQIDTHQYEVIRSSTTLEDVFIYYMQQVSSNKNNNEQ